MWLFTKYGFYSVVCAREGDGSHGHQVDPSRVMIRARARKHLDALQQRFPELLRGCKIQNSTGTDYGFRIFVSKSIWTEVMSELARELDYDNFKSEVGRYQDVRGEAYLDALHDVWSVMRRIQSGAE